MEKPKTLRQWIPEHVISAANNEEKFFCQNAGARSVVGKERFLEQFKAFTSGIFEGFTQWENLLIVGGAVVGSLMPVPEEFENDLVVIDDISSFTFLSFFADFIFFSTRRRTITKKARSPAPMLTYIRTA